MNDNNQQRRTFEWHIDPSPGAIGFGIVLAVLFTICVGIYAYMREFETAVKAGLVQQQKVGSIGYIWVKPDAPTP